MKILYDMGTGRVIESAHQEQTQAQPDSQVTDPMPPLGLQEISVGNSEKHRISPALAMLDLDVLLKDLS